MRYYTSFVCQTYFCIVEINELLKWSSSNRGKYIQCDDENIITHAGTGEAQCSLIRSSSCIPSNHYKYYFECKVKQYQKGAMGFGFTSNNHEINDDDPENDPNTLGICLYATRELRTIQYGVEKEMENSPKVNVGDVIGILLNNVQLNGTKFCVLRCFLNGFTIGFPLVGEGIDMYPSIWTSRPGNIVQSNLGHKEFRYKNLIGEPPQYLMIYNIKLVLW